MVKEGFTVQGMKSFHFLLFFVHKSFPINENKFKLDQQSMSSMEHLFVPEIEIEAILPDNRSLSRMIATQDDEFVIIL